MLLSEAHKSSRDAQLGEKDVNQQLFKMLITNSRPSDTTAKAIGADTVLYFRIGITYSQGGLQHTFSLSGYCKILMSMWERQAAWKGIVFYFLLV